MREILFRAKRIDNEEWCEGYLSKSRDENKQLKLCIDYEEKGVMCSSIVIPETVGQYTGLTDRNGKKIFEGDIVKAQDDIYGSVYCEGIVGTVLFDETAFFIETPNIVDTVYLFNECAVYEVVGNIHDNPELLKGDKNNANTNSYLP